MARFVGSFKLLLCVLFCFSATSGARGECGRSEIPVVRNVSELGYANYGRPGLAHTSIASAVHHGMKEIEVWMQTFAPNAGTPIHRHDCEEVFLTLKGYGTLYISRGSDPDRPGEFHEYSIYPNATFTIPANAVHQVKNTKEEDLQLYVSISRPPMKSFNYKDWDTTHHEAVYEKKEWDKRDKSTSEQQQCKEPEAEEEEEEEEDVMANIAKLLGASINDIVVSDEIR